MTRGRFIFLFVLLLIGVFVVAVQRDTFVRRWLVRPPPHRPLLDRVLGHVPFSSPIYDEAIAQLSRAANVRIEYFATLRSSPDITARAAPLPLVRSFQNATVERILYAIIEHWRSQVYFGSTITEQG